MQGYKKQLRIFGTFEEEEVVLLWGVISIISVVWSAKEYNFFDWIVDRIFYLFRVWVIAFLFSMNDTWGFSCQPATNADIRDTELRIQMIDHMFWDTTPSLQSTNLNFY